MDAKIVANYLTSKKEKSGLTYEEIAERSGLSISTVKNLCLGRTEDPRLNTVAPVTYAVDGSIDEMITGNRKVEVQQNSNIQVYEQYIKSINENHAREMDLKDEIIKIKDNHANFFKILACVGLSILIGILILEVTNPNLGWIRF